MENYEELINTAILTRLSYFNLNIMVELYRNMGSATAIIEQRKTLHELFPTLPPRILSSLQDIDSLKHRAEEEMEYCDKHTVSVLCLNDKAYPSRLKECPDAPLMLFYKGTADLNASRIVNIVGTRHATPYGQDIVQKLVRDLSHLTPPVIIVSGLAYGIDFHAHRNALKNNMETIGVLAHGLDNLYPTQHQDLANDMLKHGGLLTEFMTHSKPEKLNFVRRNRIVAGISDACILVESAAKGGGLITTRLSKDYHRDVFAFPGSVTATYSEGCNRLIRDNGAGLITCADDLIKAMGWENDGYATSVSQHVIERQLFPDLSPEEQKVVDLLKLNNDLQLNIISVKTGIDIGPLSSLLFKMEMKGIVKPYAGGTYHLFE